MRIRTKLLAFNLSVVGVLVAVFALLANDFYQLANLPQQEDAVRSKLGAGLAELTRQGSDALAANERGPLEALTAALSADPDFAAVVVWDKAGQRLLEIGKLSDDQRSALRASRDIRMLGDELLGRAAEVTISDFPVGTMGIAFSLSRVRRAEERVGWSALVVVIVAIVAIGASLRFSQHVTRPLQRITRVAERVAAGDLAQREGLEQESPDEVGDLSRAFASMLATLSELVAHIGETSAQIAADATEIVGSSRQHEQGATEQSSAVEETRRTMESLLESSRQIAQSAQDVLHNAETTQRNNQVVAERISKLSEQTQRISQISEAIKDIANKSDLLALNAALEGTKAGEAGRGFSLVASQMQRLAENVMEQVRGIAALTSDIRQATTTTVLATEDATKLAADTTRSARQIALIIQQQQSGTEQVSHAMDDVAHIAQQASSGSRHVLERTQQLMRLAEQLRALIQRFKLGR